MIILRSLGCWVFIVGWVFYAIFPDWKGWVPVAVCLGLFCLIVGTIISADEAERKRREWDEQYAAMTDDEKVEYHMGVARTAAFWDTAQYHNNMAQTIIQKQIRDTKR